MRASTWRDLGNGTSSCCQPNAWRRGIISSSTAPTRPTVSRWCAWSQIENTPGIGCWDCKSNDWLRSSATSALSFPASHLFMENSGGAKDRSSEVTSNSLACIPAWVQTSWLSRQNEDADLTFDPLMDHYTEYTLVTSLYIQGRLNTEFCIASKQTSFEDFFSRACIFHHQLLQVKCNLIRKLVCWVFIKISTHYRSELGKSWHDISVFRDKFQ